MEDTDTDPRDDVRREPRPPLVVLEDGDERQQAERALLQAARGAGRARPLGDRRADVDRGQRFVAGGTAAGGA